MCGDITSDRDRDRPTTSTDGNIRVVRPRVGQVQSNAVACQPWGFRLYENSNAVCAIRNRRGTTGVENSAVLNVAKAAVVAAIGHRTSREVRTVQFRVYADGIGGISAILVDCVPASVCRQFIGDSRSFDRHRVHGIRSRDVIEVIATCSATNIRRALALSRRTFAGDAVVADQSCPAGSGVESHQAANGVEVGRRRPVLDVLITEQNAVGTHCNVARREVAPRQLLVVNNHVRTGQRVDHAQLIVL